MSRLTLKNRIIMGDKDAYKILFDKTYRKLEKLEDIEEELDIELTTLFEIYNKMCEQKFVYFKIGNEIKIEYYDYYVIDFKNKEIISVEYELMGFYSFKDYGKTWALTKEELENDR